MTGSRHMAHSKANRKNYRIQSWNRKLISGVVELALDRKWAGNDHFRWSQVKVWPRKAGCGLLFQSSPKLPSCRKTRLKSKTETDRKWGRNSKKFHIDCLAMGLSYLPAKFQADRMCVGCAKSKRVSEGVCDVSVLCNLFSKTEMRQFGASGNQRIWDCREPTG